MDVKILRDEALFKEFDVTVSAKEIESQISNRLEHISPEIKITGFRPGKVPMKVVRQRYGDSAHREVLKDLVTTVTREILKEHDFRPALEPKYDVSSYERGQPLQYKFTVEVLPEINEIKFDDISLIQYDVTVNDQKVDASVQNLAEAHKDHRLLEKRADIQRGDVAVIDFKGSKDGKPFQGGDAQDYDLEIGSHAFIAGFEDALIGKKVGDRCCIDLRFPDDYSAKELAGENVRFDVTVKALKEVVPMLVSDQLAEKVGLKNLGELKESLRGRLQSEYAVSARNHTKKLLLDELDVRHTFEVPKGMVDLEFKHICKQLESQISEGEKGKKEELEKKFEIEYRPIAERRVRLGLLLAEIARLHNIRVINKELNDEILSRAQSFPGQESQVIQYFKNNNEALSSLRAPLLEEKVVNFLLAQVTLERVSMDIDQFLALIEADENTQHKNQKVFQESI